ncbi:MAG: hypothetical protein E7075_06715 [Bacteroidales bacterium]|nr:hypothetical protein [Bacteroidales bacterium]
MRNNIEIICGDHHIDEKYLTKVVAQITDNIENSNIFNDFADYAVRVLVNVNRNDYPQAQALNSKIMWMIEGDVQLSNDLLRNFLLRCIHLNLDEQFDNLLIVFYSTTTRTIQDFVHSHACSEISLAALNRMRK